MLRHEGRPSPRDLGIVSEHEDALEPPLREGDRLVIDTARRRPTTGELCALWNCSDLAVRRLGIVNATAPTQMRLTCANANYVPFTCLAEEPRVVATLLWIFRPP